MALAVQQSLFEAGGGTPMAASVRWMEGVLLGEIALGLCVIAVALVGSLMLTGRLPVREGVRIVIGCFVLLGAPIVSHGFSIGNSDTVETVQPSIPMTSQIESPRQDLPPADYDPYAGASLGKP